ncbi:pilus assembly protein [Aquabacterium sp.]|uniref:pilus assembly protein n=1 Tax=Aquabacterium sp. TaxID=1872578 RepID=UPI002C848A20|nr:PilC/PilY family type IV pilus protein [Aquabacterium sp.]HSW07803.1 PilC/PilY family type IV pilus protein [Aquabacterium sp.]
MRAASQITVSVLALAGLLFQVTSHAATTNLAEQPLKASVLAKPTVLFGMDDSGSMDGEIVIDGTDNGFFWGNTADATLYPSGAFRVGTLNDSTNLAFAYLFPNGVAAGSRMLADTTLRGIPPTTQMAWLRSSDYNPLYYDSTKIYAAWSPAYLSGASVSYSNASTTAAKSHPVLGSGTINLTADLASTTSGWKFSFAPGMIVPTGATSTGCTTGSVGTLPYTVTTTNKTCTATVSYYPATFWKKESCTIDGSTCVAAWDGSTIKRYEIKSGNSFPSGRVYADEIQNFANWFTYYRKRRLMLAAAMGATLEDMTGLRMGVVAFNSNSNPSVYDADSTVASSNSRAVAGIFYLNERGGGTPTHTTYSYIYDRFKNNTNLVQYACQRNAAFILTDGFANDTATAAPSYTQATYGAAAPYQTITSSSLADKALAYFTLQLRSDLSAGKVPAGSTEVTNPDTNTNLHLNTYGLTMGIKGSLWPARTDAFSSPAPTWPTPVSDKASMVDDLWHATVNGRGQMYYGTDVTTTAQGIKAGLLDIKSQVGAQSAVAVSTINLLAGDGQAYLASYDPAGWVGDLTANAVNRTTGVISTTALWSANDLLEARDWSTRVVFTSDGSNGLGFTAGNIGSTVNPSSATYTDAGVVDYLRGNRSGEGSTYRKRSSLMGSVINAEPVVDSSSGVVYVASGEGMLHAFNTSDGAEQWAFVPYAGLSAIGTTVDRAYSFKTKLDATPALGRYTDTARMLAGGMGAAGRSYYALDVTSPKSLTETQAAAQVKWTFPSPAQSSYAAKVEYTVGKPLIIKSTTHGYVVLVTSGYDNGASIGDGKGRMWMLNAATGAVITEFTSTAGAVGAESGLAQLNAYREDDGTVRYVYGGDLLGNVWKFDLTSGTTTLLAVLKNASNDAQPVTTAPQLTRIGGKAVIIVGTGRLLDSTDFGGTSIQSVYAFTEGTAMSNVRSSTTALTLNTGSGAVTGTVDWATSRGWHLDLPAGQQVNVDPKFVLGRLFFNTNVGGGSNCSQSSYGYVVNVKSGAGTYEVLSSTANVAHPLLVQTGDNLIRENRFNDGTNVTDDKTDLTPIAARKNAWRAISR